MLAVCWPYVGRMLAVCLPCSGRMLAVCWPYVGRMLAVYWPYVGRMLAIPNRPISRHMFTKPAPATHEGTTESVVNRDVHEAVMSHFCNCSISTRCPHRPRVTPLRKNRKYSKDLRRQLQFPVVHQNRLTNEYPRYLR